MALSGEWNYFLRIHISLKGKMHQMFVYFN